jgi:hypothetical protein
LCPVCGAERDGGLACKDRHETEVDQITALIRRNVQVGVKARPLTLVSFGVFLVAMLMLISLAIDEENPTLRTIYYMLSAFALVVVLGQVPVIRNMVARKPKS